MPEDYSKKFPVKKYSGSNASDEQKHVITYKKNSLLETLVENAEKLQQHATIANQASGLIKSIASKDPAALDNVLAEKFLTENFGEKGYDIIKTVYQNMFGK
jgi:hypothetical protein